MTTERAIQAGIVIADMIACHIRSRIGFALLVIPVLIVIAAINDFRREHNEYKADKDRAELAGRGRRGNHVVAVGEVQQKGREGD